MQTDDGVRWLDEQGAHSALSSEQALLGNERTSSSPIRLSGSTVTCLVEYRECLAAVAVVESEGPERVAYADAMSGE